MGYDDDIGDIKIDDIDHVEDKAESERDKEESERKLSDVVIEDLRREEEPV